MYLWFACVYPFYVNKTKLNVLPSFKKKDFTFTATKEHCSINLWKQLKAVVSCLYIGIIFPGNRYKLTPNIHIDWGRGVNTYKYSYEIVSEVPTFQQLYMQ